MNNNDQKTFNAPPEMAVYAAPMSLSTKLVLVAFGLVFTFFVNKLVFIVICCILCIYFYNVIAQKIVHRRAFKALENQPPDDLRPAEIGILYDHRQSVWEVVSVYLYLIAHKFIDVEIHKVGEGLLAGRHVLRATDKDRSTLRRYEQNLLSSIFADQTEITTMDVRNQAIINARLTHGIKQELQQRGYYFFYDAFVTDTYEQAQHKKLTRLFSNWKNFFAIGKGDAKYVTSKGRELWMRIAGFEHYLKVAEKTRVKFHTDPNQKQNIYIDAMAPYAVAFGIDTEWTNEIFGWEKVERTSQKKGDWEYVLKKFKEQQNKK